MSNITKTSKIGIFAMMFIAAALIDSVVTFGDNMAFATGKRNDAEQEIEQEQESEQNAQCVSGEITFASCNNVGIQLQEQIGESGIKSTINHSYFFFLLFCLLELIVIDIGETIYLEKNYSVKKSGSFY